MSSASRSSGAPAPASGPRWAERAAAALSAAGHRRGGARRAIFELLDEQRCALSAVEIEQALSARRRECSRASIYRVMEELEDLGFVQRVDVGQGIVRFEAARRGGGHHHHLVCNSCGRLEPFIDEGLERAIARLGRRLQLRVSEHEIVIRDECAACAAAPLSRH